MRVKLVLVLCAVAACATTQESKLHRAVGGSRMSYDELRIRVRNLAGRFSGLLESLGDEIAARSGDPQTQLALIRFKFNSIPAMQAALFEPDPVAAAIDAWALLVQIDQAIDKQVALPNDLRPLAHQRIGAMEQELARLWGELAGPAKVPITRAHIRQWAAAHPLTGTLASRQSTTPLLARVTASSGVTLMGAVADLVQQTQDMSLRLDVMVGFLPKLARWQAEYMVLSAPLEPTIRDAGTRFGDFVDRERLAVQAFLSSQRVAIADDLRHERAVILDDLGSQRELAFREIDQMGIKWIDHGFDRANALADRLFLRILLLVALLVAGALVALQILLSARRRRELIQREHHP